MLFWVLFGWTLLVTVSGEQILRTYVSSQDVTVLLNRTTTVDLIISGLHNESFPIKFIAKHHGLIEIKPSRILVVSNPNDTNVHYEITFVGLHPGYLDVRSMAFPANISIDDFFFRVTVAISSGLITVSQLFGWLYFILWSTSYYPQIYDNFKRKSVIGLNFDYLALNSMGIAMYALFNSGLYWSEEIQAQYFERYPTGLIPVLLNDVLFSFNSVLSTIVTVIQCFRYECAGQRISFLARTILSTFTAIVAFLTFLLADGSLKSLDFMYYCSYIKLTITLIKYIPQAVMNYRRKSTEGWAIGCIILDLFGGVFSILQMLINAYNHDDWMSILGDPTKFGMGVFSIAFDLFFMTQHYVLYRVTDDKGLAVRDPTLDHLLTQSAAGSVQSADEPQFKV